MNKIVVVTSGGMDSTVLLHYHIDRGDAVRAIAIDYGQRHKRELVFAGLTARLLHVPFRVVDLSTLRDVLPGSSQTDERVPLPEGHYTEESMKATVVPNRNMILLAIALGHAVAHRYDAVSYGAHSGDHAIYPDCREEFVDALDKAAALSDWHPARILRPFVNLTKAQICQKGHDLGVDFSSTYSCYAGGVKHCGRCGTCVERKEAFELSGVPDPTVYIDSRSSREILEETKAKSAPPA